jgi:crotonobetaine/carnitine-CoA ligase
MGGISMFLGSLRVGGRVSVQPKFSVRSFWPEIERTGATVAFLVSVMVTLVAEAPDNEHSKRCFGQLRMIGGAPLGSEIQKVFRERFGVAASGPAGFGITEANPMIVSHIGETGAPPDASGRHTPDFEVKITDSEGRECPANVPGIVKVKPLRPHVMMDGYWNNPEANAQLIVDGWFDTGDIGKFDENGFFYFVDRAKDYLRRGGENISSFEMESAFRAHPEVDEVAVHAVLSELSEDEVKVTAVLADGSSLDAVSLYTWSLERIPSFAVPRYIEFRDELPRNQVGRVLKYQLREDGVTAATWDASAAGLARRRR